MSTPERHMDIHLTMGECEPGRMEFRVEIPGLFDNEYRVLFTLPVSLYQTPGIPKLADQFCMDLVAQYLGQQGITIVAREFIDHRHSQTS